MGKGHDTITTTSNVDGTVCDKIYSTICSPCSLFRKHQQRHHDIPITPYNYMNPPRDDIHAPPPPPTAAAISGGGRKKDDAGIQDEGFSGYIERAKAKMRGGSSTFKVGSGEIRKGIISNNNNMGGGGSGGKSKRSDSLNYKVTSYIKRTKLKMMRAPSTLDGGRGDGANY